MYAIHAKQPMSYSQQAIRNCTRDCNLLACRRLLFSWNSMSELRTTMLECLMKSQFCKLDKCPTVGMKKSFSHQAGASRGSVLWCLALVLDGAAARKEPRWLQLRVQQKWPGVKGSIHFFPLHPIGDSRGKAVCECLALLHKWSQE